MQLNGPQSNVLSEIIFLSFGGDAGSTKEFGTFIEYKLNFDPFKSWGDPDDRFNPFVAKVLKKLHDEYLEKFLNALEMKVGEEGNDEGAKAVLEIRNELKKTPPPPPPSALPLPPSRTILVAAGKFEKKIAEKIRDYLRENMKGFEVIGTWENKYKLPDDIDQIPVVVASLAVPQKELADPPLNTVRIALEHLSPARRVVLLALDRRAETWTQEQLRGIDLKASVQTAPLFDDDGNTLFLRTDGLGEVAAGYRIGPVVDNLLKAFEETNTAAIQTAPPALARYGSAPVIVLGHAGGSAPDDVAQAITELTGALTQRGMEFVHWPDGWRDNRQSTRILSRDPVFICTVTEDATNTKRVAEELDKSLRSALDVRGDALDQLAGSRRVLWRTGGPVWGLLDNNADPLRSTDDIDNIETSIAAPADFAGWLERFVAPDAVIFHELLGGDRPPGFIRLLRDAVKESLSAPDRKPIIRLREFTELPSFGDDKLSIVAVDDLPLRQGPDFHSKALQRFKQFRYRIERILEQRTGADDRRVLCVAMLVQDGKLFSPKELGAWKPFRIGQDDAADPADIEALRQATAELMKPAGDAAPAGGTP